MEGSRNISPSCSKEGSLGGQIDGIEAQNFFKLVEQDQRIAFARTLRSVFGERHLGEGLGFLEGGDGAPHVSVPVAVGRDEIEPRRTPDVEAIGELWKQSGVDQRTLARA